MRILKHIAGYAAAIREFIAPTYRPERYYMRGPGPKWHAKHAAVPMPEVNLAGMAKAST